MQIPAGQIALKAVIFNSMLSFPERAPYEIHDSTCLELTTTPPVSSYTGHRSGTAPAPLRHRSGTAPAPLRHRSGTAPAPLRHRSGTAPGSQGGESYPRTVEEPAVTEEKRERVPARRRGPHNFGLG